MYMPQHQTFCMSVGDPTLGPHAFMVSTLWMNYLLSCPKVKCLYQQVGGPFHFKHTLRKYPIDLPTGQCDGGMFSVVSPSQMTLACVRPWEKAWQIISDIITKRIFRKLLGESSRDWGPSPHSRSFSRMNPGTGLGFTGLCPGSNGLSLGRTGKWEVVYDSTS